MLKVVSIATATLTLLIGSTVVGSESRREQRDNR